MSRIVLIPAILYFVGVLSSICVAADSVDIRLIEATDGPSKTDNKLDDIRSVLHSQLKFKSYRLIDTSKCPLPASTTLKMARNFIVQCSGPQSDLQVIIRRKSEKILQTVLDLKDGKPLILGGFPGDRGTLILVLLAS